MESKKNKKSKAQKASAPASALEKDEWLTAEQKA